MTRLPTGWLLVKQMTLLGNLKALWPNISSPYACCPAVFADITASVRCLPLHGEMPLVQSTAFLWGSLVSCNHHSTLYKPCMPFTFPAQCSPECSASFLFLSFSKSFEFAHPWLIIYECIYLLLTKLNFVCLFYVHWNTANVFTFLV